MTELLIRKMKQSTLTKPVKASKPTQKTSTAKPVKVKAPKVKPVKAQTRPQMHAQARPQTQSPQYQNTDFKFLTSVDQAGVSIITNFRGKSIHKFLLPNTDYALFVSLHPQQKYSYVQLRVRPNSFWGDANLIHQVILTIVNVLDTLFAEAQRILAQQQRRM